MITEILHTIVKRHTGLTLSEYGRQFLLQKAALMLIPAEARQHIDYPVNVKALFYMPTRRACDLTNMLEALDDVLVDAGVVTDDNCNVVAGHDGSRVLYDKAHPHTVVTITGIEGEGYVE